jgi:hypothetical protein
MPLLFQKCLFLFFSASSFRDFRTFFLSVDVTVGESAKKRRSKNTKPNSQADKVKEGHVITLVVCTRSFD